MIYVKELILIPHLPKTGGSSLSENFMHQLKHGEDFFHIGPKGRKDKNLKFQFETISGKKYEKLLLFGHGVGEGILNYIKYDKVSIYTVFRKPLRRLVSNFNNSYSNKPIEGGLDFFLSYKLNPICLWYIRCFPSFIEDPFSPICIQAMDVIEHFKRIFILEKGKSELDDILKIFNKSFREDLNINIGGKDYFKQNQVEKIKSKNFTTNHLQDKILYNSVLKNQSKFVLDKKPKLLGLKYHKWMSAVLFNTLWKYENKAEFIQTFNNPTFSKLLEDQLPYSKLNFTVLLKSIINQLSEIIKEDDDFTANILRLFDTISNNSIDYSILNLKDIDTSQHLGALIFDMLTSKTKLKNLSGEYWIHLPLSTEEVAIGRFNYYNKINDLDNCLDILKTYCALVPYKVQPFLKLGRFLSKYYPSHKKLIVKCAQKVTEFNTENKWANNQLKKLILNA